MVSARGTYVAITSVNVCFQCSLALALFSAQLSLIAAPVPYTLDSCNPVTSFLTNILLLCSSFGRRVYSKVLTAYENTLLVQLEIPALADDMEFQWYALMLVLPADDQCDCCRG